MKETTKKYLIGLVQDNLSAAEDNLARANAVFKNMSEMQLDQKWGQSNCTCREIWDGYIKWRDEAKSIMDELANE